jgi:hypothetical protein
VTTMTLSVATALLEVLAPVAETIPILGVPVKGALEATSKILKYADVSCRPDAIMMMLIDLKGCKGQ